MNEPADKHTWNDNYLCVEGQMECNAMRLAFADFIDTMAIIFEIFFMLGAITNFVAYFLLILIAMHYWSYSKKSIKSENNGKDNDSLQSLVTASTVSS